MLQLIPAGLHRWAYRRAHALRGLWWRFAQPTLQGVAVVATDLNDQLLLVRLSYGSGGWNVPTGGVKRGEDPMLAAQREFKEESGCEASSMTLLGIQEDRIHGTDNHVHVYSCKASGIPKADMREVIDAKFFPIHSLPEPLTKTTRRRLELYREASTQVPS